jgi:hypothetical protein
VDFPESDLLPFFYRYQRLVNAGSPFSRHRRSTASGHVVACASEGVEQQPASRVQILSGHYNTAVRVPLSLLLRESEMFDLGSVPYKDSDELCMACGLSAHTRSVQKGGLRYPALFDFAAVLHNEMGVSPPATTMRMVPRWG